MYGRFQDHLQAQLKQIEDSGLTKNERQITSAQGARVSVVGGAPVLNLCANNYLGLAQHPEVQAAAIRGVQEWGYGMA
ncbi:MAG: glycine C-acetyltransferase, partial [Porticoccaceae bacterium]|nr:glycine C-acetyltransferase [Porticoccaceae bacterium]